MKYWLTPNAPLWPKFSTFGCGSDVCVSYEVSQ